MGTERPARHPRQGAVTIKLRHDRPRRDSDEIAEHTAARCCRREASRRSRNRFCRKAGPPDAPDRAVGAPVLSRRDPVGTFMIYMHHLACSYWNLYACSGLYRTSGSRTERRRRRAPTSPGRVELSSRRRLVRSDWRKSVPQGRGPGYAGERGRSKERQSALEVRWRRLLRRGGAFSSFFLSTRCGATDAALRR
jgi:hypothetical protein